MPRLKRSSEPSILQVVGAALLASSLLQSVALAQTTPVYTLQDSQAYGVPAAEPMLLGMPAVQEELKFREEQSKEVAAIAARRAEKFREARRDLKDIAKLRETQSAIIEETGKAMLALLTPAQRARLDQIQVQVHGPLAFARPSNGRFANFGPPLLADRLKLSDEQRARITPIVDEGQTAIESAASFPLTLDTSTGPPSGDAIGKLVESPEFAAAKDKARQAARAARAAMDRRIDAVLTDEQRTAYHALVGAPFDLSRLGFGLQDSPQVDARIVANAYGLGGGQRADPSFDARVARPAYAGAVQPPRVLFDEAHNNFHTAGGRYKPFADLVTSDGYQVIPNRDKLSQEVLARGKILIIANALGGPGAREAGTSEGGFTDAECDAVRDWVREGGGLLLIADHAPFGIAAVPLAQRFGVNLSLGATTDAANSEEGATSLVFSRDNHLLGDHPITRGRDDSERLNRIRTFTGTSLKGPEGSVPFLKLADTAVDLARGDDQQVSAAGRCQGLALTFGKGRVVVLGEAGELSAQVVGFEGQKFGMNVPGIDNRQMALNIMHWLSGLLEPREGALKKAG
jgi:hypothetical protein